MYLDLALTDIRPNPDQPRKSFDQDKLDELAASIAANGLLEPVIVRSDPDDPDRWLLIAGERRWRAALLAGISSVPARVLEVTEVDAYVLSVAENVNRDNMTVMEEADAYATLRGYGKDVAEIARVFGKRPGMVAARLLLLDLEPHIRDMVEQATMGARLAWYIAKLQPGNQRVVAQKWARGEIDEATACDLATAMLGVEQEAGFFDIAEPTEEERMFHVKHQRATRSLADRIEKLSELLGDLSAADPADLAAGLGNEIPARLASVDRILRQATAARTTLRKARAHAEARSLAISEDVVA